MERRFNERNPAARQACSRRAQASILRVVRDPGRGCAKLSETSICRFLQATNSARMRSSPRFGAGCMGEVYRRGIRGCIAGWNDLDILYIAEGFK
jgi:hypothetical protein